MNTTNIEQIIHDLVSLKQETQIESLVSAVRREEIPAAQALHYVDRVMDTFKRVSLGGQEDAFTLKVLLGVGESYETLSCLEQSAATYQEALETARRLKDRGAEANLLWRIGRVYRKRNRWEEALDHLHKGQSIFQAAGDVPGVARCLISEGIVNFERGDYPSATEAYRQALETGERIDDRRLVADATLNLGILATIRGDLDDALGHYRSSLSLFEQVESPGALARTYHNLGMCFIAREGWTEALDAFEKSLEISQKQGNLRQSAMTYVQKAAVYLELSDATVAATYCAKALDIFQKVDFPLGVAEVHKVLGSLFTRRQNWATAQGLLEESLRLCRQYRNPLGEAETHRAIGALRAARNEREQAHTSFEEALRLFENLGARREAEITRNLLQGLNA